MSKELLKNIPNVNRLLDTELLQNAIDMYDRDVVVYATRLVLSEIRATIHNGGNCSTELLSISNSIVSRVTAIYQPTLKPVINATGTVIHTNLGRAPLGQSVIENLADTAGYTNIEFDLKSGGRGHRSVHAKEALKYITGAEDVAVVNNNAAAVLLLLQTFAQGKEVILSRGEMIEVGGAFRIPDIMKSSGAKLVEIGCTNKTRISDYEDAITEDTEVIFKVHHSNFSMSGFVEEASVEELVELCKRKNLILIYDLGSGLLRKPKLLRDIPEHDVATAVKLGVDLVSFSTDKLMGGPQGGVIVGKSALVQRCNKHPLMRSLRVGKLTYSALSTVCRDYLTDETLLKNNPLFASLSQTKDEILVRAKKLLEMINLDSEAEIVESKAQVGGGTLPDFFIDSYSVKIKSPSQKVREREAFSEKLYYGLMQLETPIIAVLKEGFVHFDLFTLLESQLEVVADSIKEVLD